MNWYFLCNLLQIAIKIYINKDPDIEDEDEDLLSICQSLKNKSIYYQLPYLIKNYELWFSENNIDSKERIRMEQALHTSQRNSFGKTYLILLAFLMISIKLLNSYFNATINNILI